MYKYKFTPYFENEVLRKRPYIKKEWCVRAIEELDGKILRVVTLADKVTIHNAFSDKRFKL